MLSLSHLRSYFLSLFFSSILSFSNLHFPPSLFCSPTLSPFFLLPHLLSSSNISVLSLFLLYSILSFDLFYNFLSHSLFSNFLSHSHVEHFSHSLPRFYCPLTCSPLHFALSLSPFFFLSTHSLLSKLISRFPTIFFVSPISLQTPL